MKIIDRVKISKLAETVEKIGYKLVSFKDCLNGFTVVIAKNGCEYVTWIYNNETNSLFSGNYFTHFGDTGKKLKYWELAFSDYHKRVEKEKLN